MQIYALNEQNEMIHAREAKKACTYRCVECGSELRSRGGVHRQKHFYHKEPNRTCRLHRKGIIHIHVQNLFYQKLPLGDCALEYQMPEIGRIADIAWLSKKIVFEIQYSPISAEEVLARNADYRKLGWSVIWILHDHFYNQFRLKAAEQVLRFFPHYFTNVNQVGEGVVYDQFDLINQGLRIDKMSPLLIDFSHVQTRESFQLSTNSLVLLTQRLDKWSHFFMGDLMSLDEDHSHFYYQTAKEKERIFLESNKNKKWTFMVLLRLAIYKFMIRPYRFVFQLLLEKICH